MRAHTMSERARVVNTQVPFYVNEIPHADPLLETVALSLPFAV
jgi:hypothetical protein